MDLEKRAMRSGKERRKGSLKGVRSCNQRGSGGGTILLEKNEKIEQKEKATIQQVRGGGWGDFFRKRKSRVLPVESSEEFLGEKNERSTVD